jgi:hypothetical protein
MTDNPQVNWVSTMVNKRLLFPSRLPGGQGFNAQIAETASAFGEFPRRLKVVNGGANANNSQSR